MSEYTNSRMKTIIDECIHSERDRQILSRRLLDGVVFEKLAEEFNLSTRQVKAIVYRGQSTIRKFI